MSSDPNDRDLPTEALLALNEGRLLDAIRLYREAHGLGLKEAKDAIDRYLALHPALGEQIRSRQQQQRRRVLAWLAALGAGIALALALLQRS